MQGLRSKFLSFGGGLVGLQIAAFLPVKTLKISINQKLVQ